MPTTPKKSDQQLQTDVQNQLCFDTRVDAAAVGVSARDGVVTLSGTVDSWAQRHAAQQSAHRVAGVRDVANDVVVRVPGALGRTDADIAKAARQALEWDVRLPDEDIQTTVARGVITLEGAVECLSQCVDAEEAVRHLAGVQGVDNKLTVAPKATPVDVRAAVCDALSRQALGEARSFDIALVDGCVTLSGTVHSWAERQAALNAAGATAGVRAVVDQLRVQPWR